MKMAHCRPDDPEFRCTRGFEFTGFTSVKWFSDAEWIYLSEEKRESFIAWLRRMTLRSRMQALFEKVHVCQPSNPVSAVLYFALRSPALTGLSITDAFKPWSPDITASMLELLPRFRRLEQLRLHTKSVDELPAVLMDLPALNHLVIHTWRVISRGWENLPSQLRALELHLHRGRRDPVHQHATVPTLGGMTQLTKLAVTLHELDPAHLANLTALQHLQLNSMDDEFSRTCIWANLPRLTRLDLENCDSDRYGLANMRSLRELRIGWGPETEHEFLLSELATLTWLTSLELFSFRTRRSSDTDWQQLEHLCHLRHLALRQCCLYRVPEVLAGLRHLTSLDLTGSLFANVRHRDMNHFPESLRRLSLATCGLPFVPDRLIALTRLQHLDLSRCSVESGWRHLPRTLETLVLGYFASALPRELRALRRLRELEMTTSEVVPGGWQNLPPNLKVLKICGPPHIRAIVHRYTNAKCEVKAIMAPTSLDF